MDLPKVTSYSTQRRHIRKAVNEALAPTLAHQFSQNDDDDICDSSLGADMNCSSRDFLVLDNPGTVTLPVSETFETTASCTCEVLSCDDFDVYDDMNVYCDDESDYSVDSDDNDNEQLNEKPPLASELAEWAVEAGVTLSALSSLLSILHPYHNGLPLDARTLLKTPRSYEIKNLVNSNGQYYHFGIQTGISSYLTKSSGMTSLTSDMTISLQFNIDGLPLFKSSSTEFWPILGRVKLDNARPFIIGIFCGKGKPADVAEFLADFLSELQTLLVDGMRHGNDLVNIAVDCFICDAPARAYLKNIKSHCGFYGCEKCKQEGSHQQGRMTFPDTEVALRTDTEFLAMIDEVHHKGPTPLSKLPIGLVSDFVLDYMHLVCLGVVRRMLKFWMKGPLDVGIRLQSRKVQLLSERLKLLANSVPREFQRRPRSILEIDRWKAVEFRQFLLYTGVAVLPGIVSDEVFNHFLLLSVGIFLLAHPVHHRSCNSYAEELLKMFVKQSLSIYGPLFVVYNVHALIHLPADVLKHGYLDSISAFPFENELKFLKSLVRKAEIPLSQVVRRLSEQHDLKRNTGAGSLAPLYVLKYEHAGGPLPKGFDCGRQFRELRLKNMRVHSDSADNCVCVSDVGPVLVQNIVQLSNKDIYIICETFNIVNSLFSYPLDSTFLGIFEVAELSGECVGIPVTRITAKCARLPLLKDSHFAVLSLIHCGMC